MWKLDFFILPSKNYEDIDENDAYEFGEKAEYISRTEKLYIPDEFYDVPDNSSGLPIWKRTK